MLSLAVLLVLVINKPYRRTEDQILATSSHTMSLVAFFGASFIKAFGEVEEEVEHTSKPKVAQKVFGFSSADSIVIVLLLFTVAMIILLLVTLGYIIAHEGRVHTIREKSTGKPLELTTAETEKWHLFM